MERGRLRLHDPPDRGGVRVGAGSRSRYGHRMADHDLDRYRDPEPRHIRNPWRFYLWLIAGQKWRVVRAGVYGSSWMIGLTVPPFLLSKAIDEGLEPKDLGVLAE